MSERAGAFDIIVIADTLIYFGVLDQAFRSVFSALAPGGTLAFTLEVLREADSGPGYRLEAHGRYTHRATYMEQALRESGLTLLKNDTVVLRRECDADVRGLAVLARKEP
jgi:predicted TPR repeat methyltransferase